jgi:hypothetical protein
MLDTMISSGNPWTGNLADYSRLYDNGDYENDAVVQVGTDRTAVSGTWSVSESAIQTSTPGDYATFVINPCQSMGIDTNFGVGASVLSWRVDGGGWNTRDCINSSVTSYSAWIGTVRGSHTFDIRMDSGTLLKINRVLAI